MHIIVHQLMNLIFLGEPFNDITFVLEDTLKQIVSDTDVERTIPFAVQNVDVILFMAFMDSCLRAC